MALSVKELASLLSVLSEDTTQTQSFESLATSFHHYFTKQDHFKVGSSIVLLLQNRDLLPHPTQKLAAIFLLYEMYRTDPIAANPFATVFVHILNPPTENQEAGQFDLHWAIPAISPAERYFLSQLISSPTKEIHPFVNLCINMMFKKTPTQIIQLDVSSMQNFDVSGLQLALAERQSEMPAQSKSAMPCVVPDRDTKPSSFDHFGKPGVINPDVQRQTIESLLTGNKAPVENCMMPEFIRLAPPLHIAEDELCWMNPVDMDYSVAWDTTMCVSSSAGVEIRRLMSKAFKGALTLQQQQQLLDELEKDNKLVYHIGLTPAKKFLSPAATRSRDIEMLGVRPGVRASHFFVSVLMPTNFDGFSLNLYRLFIPLLPWSSSKISIGQYFLLELWDFDHNNDSVLSKN
ncbi:CCR4-NOT transcription complex subunit 11 isoform X3 [Magallana gigas]|uniref:CCR4-NOT transcription complex subunit 11 isoform X3 n=1 Tax=Magallana gigas TaxID=29159 RepID=UPI003341D37C